MMLIVIVLLFLLALPDMKFENILPIEFKDPKKLTFQATEYFALSFGQGIILPCFLCEHDNKSPIKTHMLGLFLGGAVLFVCLLHSIMIFGTDYLSLLEFPYASAMSVISLGYKFSRMEGLSYFIYFACCLIKTSVCVIVAKELLGKIFTKIKAFLIPLFLIVILFFCISENMFKSLPFEQIALIFGIPSVIIPPILLLRSSKYMRGQAKKQ